MKSLQFLCRAGIKQREGIISVNVGQMHQVMLDAGKKYIDMTSNNVNHPNDFMASIYAMNILSLLLDEHNEVHNERYNI